MEITRIIIIRFFTITQMWRLSSCLSYLITTCTMLPTSYIFAKLFKTNACFLTYAIPHSCTKKISTTLRTTPECSILQQSKGAVLPCVKNKSHFVLRIWKQLNISEIALYIVFILYTSMKSIHILNYVFYVTLYKLEIHIPPFSEWNGLFIKQ